MTRITRGTVALLLALTMASVATARQYSPATGRYVQADPIGLNGGWNLYGYANGNLTLPLFHASLNRDR